MNRKVACQRVALAVGIVVLSIAGVGQTPKAAPKTAAKKSIATKAPYNKALLNPSLLKAKAPEQFDVKFTTTKGDFTIHVVREWAPFGADRFYNLAKNHFF